VATLAASVARGTRGLANDGKGAAVLFSSAHFKAPRVYTRVAFVRYVSAAAASDALDVLNRRVAKHGAEEGGAGGRAATVPGAADESFALNVERVQPEWERFPQRFAPGSAARPARIAHDLSQATALAEALDFEASLLAADAALSGGSGRSAEEGAHAETAPAPDVGRLLAAAPAEWTAVRRLDLVLEYLLRVHLVSYYYHAGAAGRRSGDDARGADRRAEARAQRFCTRGDAWNAGAGGAVFRDFSAASAAAPPASSSSAAPPERRERDEVSVIYIPLHVTRIMLTI